MDANQNQPSERKIVIDFSKIPQQPPIEWSTGAWNGPLIELDPNDPFGDLERKFNPGVHVTAVVPPEQGWPIAMHCPICKETNIILSLYGSKPSVDGKEFDGYHKLKDVCGHETLGFEHNMQLAARGPHLLTARDGEQDYCGGPGLCKWCDEGDKNGNS